MNARRVLLPDATLEQLQRAGVDPRRIEEMRAERDRFLGLQKRFRFHCAHGGGIVGRQAEGALQAARAEILLEEAVDLGVASVNWHDDETEYDAGDAITPEEVKARFESNEWTGPYGCVIIVDPNPDQDDATHVPEGHASCWGIVLGQAGTRDPYARVMEAELALELLDELRQTIGDHRDDACLSCGATFPYRPHYCGEVGRAHTDAARA